MQRVTTKSAAEQMQMDLAALKAYVKWDQFNPPIGRYVKLPGAKRGTYLIYQEKIDEYLSAKK